MNLNDLLILTLLACALVSGCTQTDDPIVGSWIIVQSHMVGNNTAVFPRFDNLNNNYQYYNYTVEYYPDIQYFFYNNGAIKQYEIVNQKINESYSKTNITINWYGTWTNLGDGNYSIRFYHENQQEQNMTIQIKDDYLYRDDWPTKLARFGPLPD